MNDPTAMSPAELEEAGVRLVGFRPAEATGAVWRAHSEVIAANRAADEVQRTIARMKAAAWLVDHGSLEGLMLSRSFPCLGRFRITDDDGKRPATVECDRCGERLGVAQEALRAEPKMGGQW